MPVVGHRHEGEDAHRVLGKRLGQDAQERRIIGGFLKQGQACHGAI